MTGYGCARLLQLRCQNTLGRSAPKVCVLFPEPGQLDENPYGST